MPKQPGLFSEYLESKELFEDSYSFYGLIMAAMRKADTPNSAKLQAAWPQVFAELMARYNAPCGALTPNEIAYVKKQRG